MRQDGSDSPLWKTSVSQLREILNAALLDDDPLVGPEAYNVNLFEIHNGNHAAHAPPCSDDESTSSSFRSRNGWTWEARKKFWKELLALLESALLPVTAAASETSTASRRRTGSHGTNPGTRQHQQKHQGYQQRNLEPSHQPSCKPMREQEEWLVEEVTGLLCDKVLRRCQDAPDEVQ